ncbi:conserved protein of unknown function [Pseudodesulfovibrio profundus]|uniref:Uncharacterized protein n=1 Tax=Pseudodesulfovibrio profundus TaxID=57320 RepID=A0A2C8F3F8_9BACT|nr:hypothetical protein [Pseudodesulfovibrio profundus]SOB57081.1 conserved protein of unknown function [Pseudodesulfovibrio profundus]|tara:strand:+ start:982 stop:1308 length:327 start_codon:yes stop_codon:yes gene_type:complete
MSSTPLDLPVLISQMHHVAKIAHAERAKPEAEKQLFGPLLQQRLRDKEGKVQQVNKKEQTSAVDRDGRHASQHDAPQKERTKKQEESDKETTSANPSPWSGNIVNVKI